jgi:hypothetical protein
LGIGLTSQFSKSKFVEKMIQLKFQPDGCLTVRNGGKLYWKSTTDCSAREDKEEEEYRTFIMNQKCLTAYKNSHCVDICSLPVIQPSVTSVQSSSRQLHQYSHAAVSYISTVMQPSVTSVQSSSRQLHQYSHPAVSYISAITQPVRSSSLSAVTLAYQAEAEPYQNSIRAFPDTLPFK